VCLQVASFTRETPRYITIDRLPEFFRKGAEPEPSITIFAT